MRTRSRFIFGIEPWEKVYSYKVFKDIWGQVGNYCYWTENEENREKLEDRLQDHHIQYTIDWQYDVAENEDIEALQIGDKIRFKGESIIGDETSAYIGTVIEIIPHKEQIKKAPWGGTYVERSPAYLKVRAKKEGTRKRYGLYILTPIEIRYLEII